MWMSKLKAAVAVVLALACMGIGGAVLTCRTAAWGDQPSAAEGPVKTPQGQEKEGSTAWGKEVNGLQAGLGYRPGQKRAYRHGETVTLVVRVRNVSKQEVKFSYLHPHIEHAPR